MASHIWEIIFTDPVIHRYVCSTCGVKLIVPVTVPLDNWIALLKSRGDHCPESCEIEIVKSIHTS